MFMLHKQEEVCQGRGVVDSDAGGTCADRGGVGLLWWVICWWVGHMIFSAVG